MGNCDHSLQCKLPGTSIFIARPVCTATVLGTTGTVMIHSESSRMMPVESTDLGSSQTVESLVGIVKL